MMPRHWRKPRKQQLWIGIAPGTDGISAEILKVGGEAMAVSFPELMQQLWEAGSASQDFKDANTSPEQEQR